MVVKFKPFSKLAFKQIFKQTFLSACQAAVEVPYKVDWLIY